MTNFVKLWGRGGAKDCQLGPLGTINARIYFALLTREQIYNLRNRSSIRNSSKLIERSLLAIIDLLKGGKSILLYMSFGGTFS